MTSEADLQRQIIDLAQLTGWLVHHTRPSQGGPCPKCNGRKYTGTSYCPRCKGSGLGYRTHIQGNPGFPDLVLAHPHHGLLLVELKSETGRTRPAQHQWANTLQTAETNGHTPPRTYRLWRPSDWPEIEATLRRHPTSKGTQR